MNETRELLERVGGRFKFPDEAFDRMLRRRHRQQRNHRIAAAAVGIAVVIVATAVGLATIGSPSRVAGEPEPPLLQMQNGPIGVFGYLGGVRSFDEDGLGGFVIQCGHPCTNIRDASWSPDGTRLAFIAVCGGGCGSYGGPYHGVRVYEPSTGTDRLIVSGEDVTSIAWSPDGSRIAYATDRPDLYVMNPDGSERRALWTPASDGGPRSRIFSLSWSPDGSRIVGTLWVEVGGGATADSVSLSVVELDGDLISIGIDGWSPVWSPDGSSIAYLAGCEIRVTTPDGTQDRSLVDLSVVLKEREVCDGTNGLQWSPDGKQLVAMVAYERVDPDVPSRAVVVLVGADGAHPRVVSELPRGVHGLTWQPIP